MVIKVITKLGHVKIVKKFIDFILDIIPDKNEKLRLCMVLMEKKC